MLTSKKREYYDTKISELENSTNNLDQTSFWKCLKSIDDTVKQKDVPLLISEQNWLYYFQSLLSNKPLNSTWEMTSNELTHLEIRKNQPCPLDYTSTDDEIRAAANKLKNKRSPFSDKIKNEMIKASINDMLPVYYKLFNLILYSGTMPSSTWCDGLAWPHYFYLQIRK